MKKGMGRGKGGMRSPLTAVEYCLHDCSYFHRFWNVPTVTSLSEVRKEAVTSLATLTNLKKRVVIICILDYTIILLFCMCVRKILITESCVEYFLYHSYTFSSRNG